MFCNSNTSIQAPWTICWRPCSEHLCWEWGFRTWFHCSLSGYGLGFQVSAGCHRVFHALWLQNTSAQFWYCFWVSVWNSLNMWKLPNKIIELKQRQAVLPLAVRKNICDGQPLSEHLHRELNSSCSSTCDNCMSESSLKKENIFSTAPDVLSIILSLYGDGEKKQIGRASCRERV